MRVKIKSDAEELAKRAEQEMSLVPHRVFDAMNDGAKFLRSFDAYTDRSGDLRAHTTAEITTKSNDSVQVDLKMAEQYASYVVKRGFSKWDWLIPELSRELNKALAAIGKRINRGR